MVGEVSSAYLAPRSKGRLIGSSALSCVNHQVRREFLPLYYLHSRITATIYGWNFRHVVSFLNRLGKHELKALEVNPGRAMIFRIHISPVPKKASNITGPAWSPIPLELGDPEPLWSWLRHLERRKKRGIFLNFSRVMLSRNLDLFWWLWAFKHLAERLGKGPDFQEIADMGIALCITLVT